MPLIFSLYQPPNCLCPWLILAVASQEVFGAERPAEIVDVLKFALTLEHIEDAFYRSGLEAKGLGGRAFGKPASPSAELIGALT